MAHKAWVPGGLISVDPLVTYTRQGGGAPVGIAPVYPEVFRGRRSLHFVGFSHTAERDGIANLAAQLARAEAELPENRFVILANSDYEALQLRAAGVPATNGSNLIFISERIYRPLPVAQDLPHFDAVYNARFDPFKRHELATKVDSLMLVYDNPADQSGAPERRVRGLLPHAWFAQNELGGGTYRKSTPDMVCRLLNQCRVGLCLSAAEGAMRASMEYLLCGLMVVSTPNIGGRDRFLIAPYARFAPPEPDAIAAAVKAMLAAPIPKQAIRDFVANIVAFDRHNFLLTANRIAREHFGREIFSSITPFLEYANVWRTAAEVMEPLLAR